MDDAGQVITAFVVAAGLGAVIGLERQAARGNGTDSYAGVRTFALYAVWGAGSAFSGDRYGGAAFAVAAVGFTAVLVASYVISYANTGDWGTTTEAAAFSAFVVGVLSWADQLVAALALAVGTAALLRGKEALHQLAERFSDEDLRAVLQFGVLTAVVLPLVPDEDFGPFDAINPRRIWWMVVLVSAIGLAGYVAFRLRGSRGLGASGLLGGLVSSTAVTLGFSRMSREWPGLRSALVAGVLGASGLMYGRVLVEALVISPPLAARLVVPMAVLFVLVQAMALLWWRRPIEEVRPEADFRVRNPLTLTTALQFGMLYGAVVFVSKALIDRVSSDALNLLGVVSGIHDVDAITLAAADLVRGGLDVGLGAQVVIAAVTTNTLVKGGMALVLGSRALGKVVAPSLAVAAAVGAVAWFLV